MCSKTGASELRPVWTHRTQHSVVTHPCTDAVATADASKGWVTLQIRRQSGACSVSAGLQYSNDGESWDAAVAFGPSFTSTEGYAYDTAFTDLAALGTRKRWVRFVLLCKNVVASEVEYCEAGLSVQLSGMD